MLIKRSEQSEAILSPADGSLAYMTGFENSFATEVVLGTLPLARNSPQNAPHGLYAEQLSGSAFTAPRHSNKRTWFYRIRPSVKHGRGFRETDPGLLQTATGRRENPLPVGQLRWLPIEIPSEPCDFLQGLRTVATCGDVHLQVGMAVHVYVANQSMDRRYFYNADGELLLVPQENPIRVFTECGRLEAEPGEIILIPTGMKFRVDLPAGVARGYVCENYGQYFTLPERGPIGANCLANARDFLTPVAAFEDREEPCELSIKSQGKLYVTGCPQSPLDVVAWHGNFVPCKYDLRRFSPVGSVRFDHPDPSIYTVLTAPSERAGTANVDLVIFPDRWLVMEDTFRPPWYHMNIMSEFMGLIYGVYDAKPGGFVPGGMSLHNSMIAHGPDSEAFEKGSNKKLAPERLDGTMAFMFETRYQLIPTKFASNLDLIDQGYPDCWDSLKRNYP